MNPLVSIIIPVYNGANYLEDAINSALAQTYSNIEIIVVNDGSRDDGATEAVALKYADRIRYIPKENGGVSSALNTGIRAMKGSYFSWLSHDDLYEPTKVEEEVRKLETDRDIVLCSGRLIDFEGNPMKHASKCIDAKLNPSELFHKWLWSNYELNGLGFLIPRCAFEEAGYFDESLSYLQDLDMWIRMMFKNYTFICIPKRLVITRIHKSQTTNLHKEKFFSDGRAMRLKHIDMIISSKTDKKFVTDYIYLCVKSGLEYPVYKPLEDYIKGNDSLPLVFYLNKYFFKVKGIFLKNARIIRDFFLKLEGLRG